jgi:hypothetical protein
MRPGVGLFPVGRAREDVLMLAWIPPRPYAFVIFVTGLLVLLPPVATAQEALEIPDAPTLMFYPDTEFTFRSEDPSVGGIVWFTLRSVSPTIPELVTEVTRESDQSFRVQLSCPAYGPAELLIHTDSSRDESSLVHIEKVLCEIPMAPGDLGGLTTFRFSATAAAPPPAGGPTIITPMVDTYHAEQRYSGSATTTRTYCSGQTSSYTDSILTEDIRTYGNGMACSRYRSQYNNYPPYERESCHPAAPAPMIYHPSDYADFQATPFEATINRSEGEVGDCSPRDPPSALDALTQIGAYTRTFDLTFTLSFPGLPEGGTITELRAVSSEGGFTITKPVDAFKLDGREPTLGTEQPLPGTCPETFEGEDITWTFSSPTLTPDKKLTLSFTTEARCPVPGIPPALGRTETLSYLLLRKSSVPGRIARMMFEADVMASELELILEPVSTSIVPSGELVGFPGCQNIHDPDFFGTSSTDVKAKLTEAPEGTYTVRIKLDGFEAEVSGHAHAASPPQSLWGSIGNGGVEDTCEIVIDASSNGEGECTLPYQASRVAGPVKLVGTVDGETAEDEKTIDVQIPGLVPLQGSSLYFLTGNTSPQGMRHPDNHHARPSTIVIMQKIALLFFQATNARLGVNDMSIEWGGIFDIDGNWSPPHCTHRDGVDADIDRAWLDASGNPIQTVNCSSDVDLDAAVRKAGARLFCEVAGMYKHIDFPR